MQYFAVSALALAGVAAAASNSTVTPSGASCQAAFGICTADAATCSASLNNCKAQCSDKYNTCRVAPNANMATCAADYATCLGTNPFNNNGTAAGAGAGAAGAGGAAAGAAGQAGAGGVAVTTEVVTSFTTFCPYATQVTFNGQVYTASSATTLTITNCPCTITKAVSSVPAGATGSMTTQGGSSATPVGQNGGSGNGNSTGSYTPQAFTGEGNRFLLAGSSLVAGIAGLAFFL